MGKTFSDVILVVKEPINPSSLPNKYCKLKKMLSTKTYLEWPQQVSQQAFFWAQLRSVLGRPSPTTSRRYSARSRTYTEETQPLDDTGPDNGKLNVAIVGEPGNKIQENSDVANQRQLPVAGN